jgi:hypothetical protein
MRAARAAIVGLLALFPLDALAYTAPAPKPRASPTAAQRPSANVPRARAHAAPRTAAGSPADAKRYGEKQALSRGAQNFRGGDDVVVVVGASTLTLVLAIVLLVVLL